MFSATKSQANITNNNFAKFSSSGYTNNAFMLMSGHHDFTQNDFNVNIQPNQQNEGSNERTFKSTSKTRPMPTQPNFVLQQRRSSNENT